MDDDLIKAALIEDEEDLRLKEAKSTEEKPSEEAETPEENDEEAETADEEESEDTEEEPDEELKGESKEETPSEVSEEKPTRKERRAERKAWLDSVRKDQEQIQSQQQQQQPKQDDYTPVDYRTLDEIEADRLEEDRQKYGENSRTQGEIQGREQERFLAEQKDFWKDVEHEATLLNYDPKFSFLDENKPDTFDPDLAADLNEKYLEFVGYNPQSNTVQRTNISYRKFIEKEMGEREAWAERQAADSQRVVEETKATTSVRPGGTRKSGLGKLKPGDISKMSPAEFAKHEAEIDRQIMQQLGAN